ncbi:hypothetical protein C8J56DRAFT_961317 [Mycena floridula]|nr:hypothetical protein C8J56DRAFT_961317 [Mycena floridula]
MFLSLFNEAFVDDIHRVVSWSKCIDDTLLTYTKNSKNQAIYAIAGTANVPTITYQRLETIIHYDSPPPPQVPQIIVSDDTAGITEITEPAGGVYAAEYPRNAIELVKRNIAALISTGMIVAGSAMLLPTLAILALNAVGFTLSGVAAGSLAAAIQSAFYGGATTGLFSILQSLGATAAIGSPVLPIIGGVLAGVGTGWKIYEKHRDAAGKDSNEIEYFL